MTALTLKKKHVACIALLLAGSACGVMATLDDMVGALALMAPPAESFAGLKRKRTDTNGRDHTAVSPSQQLRHSLERYLAAGDFESLNAVLVSAELVIDESPVITEDISGSTLTINLANITCRQLQFGDISIDWNEVDTSDSSTLLLSNVVQLDQVDLNCRMEYTYDYLFFSGAGTLNLITADSTIITKTDITTTMTSTSQQDETIKVNMTSCSADIVIEDMQFDGDNLGLLGSALTAIDGLIRQTVSDKMQAYLCTFLGRFQKPLKNGLAQFLGMLGANETTYEPLRTEANLQIPKSVSLLNFRNPQAGDNGEASSGMSPQIVTTLIDQVSGFLSATASDGSLNLNRLLRESLLDKDDKSMTVDLTTLIGTGNSSSSSSRSSDDEGLVLFDNQNELGNWTLRFTSARIVGLDSFTKIDPLEAIGKYTLESNMTMDGISVQLDADLIIKTSEKALTEAFVLDISLADISLSIALLLGIDINKLGQVPLGAFMDMSNVLPCITSSIYRLASTGLDIQSMTILAPSVSGFVSPGLQRIMSEGLDAIFSSYNSLLAKSLPNLMESIVVDMLDKALTALLGGSDTNSSCPTTDVVTSDVFIDFRDLFLAPDQAKDFGASGTSPYGDLASVVKQFVNDQLLQVNEETGRTGLADMFIIPITKNQSGTGGSLFMKDVVDFSGTMDVGDETATLALTVRDVEINNLDSLGAPLFFLEAVNGEAFLLNNTVTFGAEPNPIQLQANLLIDLELGDEHIYNDVLFALGMTDASALFELFMKMSEKSVMAFPLQDIFVWQCWLATIPAPALDSFGRRSPESEAMLSLPELAMSIASMNFSVVCQNCSSTRMHDFAEMISSAEMKKDVERSASNVIGVLLDKLSGPSSFIQTTLDRLLVNAVKFCPHSPQFDPNATKTTYDSIALDQQDSSNLEYMIALLATMVAIGVVAGLLFFCLRRLVARRHKQWLAGLSSDQLWAVFEDQKRKDEDEAAVNNNSSSLFLSKEIPFLLRWFAPMVLVGNIFLFLSGHFSKGGTVELHIEVGGQKVSFTDFYTFSIAQTGVELWGAGYKPLAILLLIVSGIWPYAKQLITIALWFLPPRWVSTSARGRVLLVMDYLAKWSMVDVFVMIVCLAAFRVQIHSPDLPFVPDRLYQLDILVVPVWGLYANMLAQLLSQFTSHFIIGYHRLVVYKAQKEVICERKAALLCSKSSDSSEVEGGETVARKGDGFASSTGELLKPTDSTTSESSCDINQIFDDYPLYRHSFTRPHRGDLERLIVKPFVNICLIVLAVAIFVLTIVGCSLPAVSFDYRGIVGIAVESGQDFKAAKEYVSIFSLAKLMMDQARFLDTAKDKVGMLSVSTLLLLSTLFVPLALVAVLGVEWFSTHSLKVRRRLRSTVEILQAWQYIEVLVLSIIIGAWQIGDVSELLLDDYCGGSLGAILSDFASFGLIKVEDAKCFRVQAEVESAAFILILAGVLLIILSSFVSMAVSQRTRDETRMELDQYAPLVRRDLGDDDKIVPSANIRPAPVLFTDQFRWCLMATGKDHDRSAKCAL